MLGLPIKYFINQHSQTYIWTVHECILSLSVILDFKKINFGLKDQRVNFCSQKKHLLTSATSSKHFFKTSSLFNY